MYLRSLVDPIPAVDIDLDDPRPLTLPLSDLTGQTGIYSNPLEVD